LNKIHKCIIIQSNLCTMTALGTPKRDRCLEVVFVQRVLLKNYYLFWLYSNQDGRSWQVVVVWSWSLTQVWLFSQTCEQQPPLGLKKVAVFQKLRQSGRCSQFIPVNLLSVLENWGSSWPLYTGGRCSEVVINTRLTVHLKKQDVYRMIMGV